MSLPVNFENSVDVIITHIYLQVGIEILQGQLLPAAVRKNQKKNKTRETISLVSTVPNRWQRLQRNGLGDGAIIPSALPNGFSEGRNHSMEIF